MADLQQTLYNRRPATADMADYAATLSKERATYERHVKIIARAETGAENIRNSFSQFQCKTSSYFNAL